MNSLRFVTGPIRRYLLVLLLAAAACVLTPASGAAEPEALDISKMTAIVTGSDPSALEKNAASELSSYLGRMYGVKLPVEQRNEIGPDTTGVILLGAKAALACGAVTESELDAVKWDGYVIKAGSGRIALAGPRARATLYGVAGLLEKLGCRFYGSFEILPRPETALILSFALAERPFMEFRRVNMSNWTLKTSGDDIGDPREAANPALFTSEAGSDLWIDHTAGYLVPPELYFKDHPEYYALVNGKRVASDRDSPHHRVTLCLSNPDVTRISIERTMKWIEAQPEKRFFAITYGDTDAQCQCENCRELDPTPGRHQDRLLHWVNAVARAVAEKRPDKAILSFAYGNTRWPPEKTLPEPNVIVLYAPFFGVSTICRSHPYYVGANSQPAAMEMEDWFKRAPRNLGIYEYSLGPAIKMRAYEKKFKFWAKRGFRGFWECGQPVELKGIETFVKAKLAWDPSLDPIALEKEYCGAWYGPAGVDAWEFLDCVFAVIGDDRDVSYPGERPRVEKGIEAYERAVKAAAGTEFEKRLKEDSDLAAWAAEFKKRLETMKQAAAAAPAPTKAPDAEKPERTLSLSKSAPMRRSGFKLDAEFTPLKAILVSGDLAEDYKAALALRNYIEETYKVALPVEKNSVEINENTREVFLVGRKAALASGLVAESDFEAAGPSGIVARGRDGRIALAASKDENISDAVEGFIHVDRARRPVAGGWRMTTFGWIREFTLIDRPPFGPAYPAAAD